MYPIPICRYGFLGILLLLTEAAIADCRYGTVRQGNDCVPIEKTQGGAWHGDELRCDDGYARLQTTSGKLSCHRLPRLTNGYYQGPIANCPAGFVLVNWRCTPKSLVNDKSLVMNVHEFCPSGFNELNNSCVPATEDPKLNVGKLKVQHLYLGITEELVFNALLDNDYEHYEDPSLLHNSRGFRKYSADGTYREIIVKLNGNPLTVFEIHYIQEFQQLRFDYSKIRSAIIQRYGAPSDHRYYRERDLLIYRDEPSKRAPTLEISFPGNQVIFHLVSRKLEAKLIEQTLAMKQRNGQVRSLVEVLPELEF